MSSSLAADRVRATSHMRLITCLLLLLTNSPTVLADDHGVVFLYPTRGLVFYYLDVVNVSYTSSFPTPNLYTFCDGGNRQVDVRPAAPFNGTTMVPLNFASDTNCWFNLRPGTEPGHGANSPSFGMVNTRRPASSSESSTTTTSSPTPDPTSGSSATISPTADSTQSPVTSDPSKSGGLSSGAAAGIGVGVSLGALAVLGAAGFFFWRKRKARKVLAAEAKNGGDYGVAPGWDKYHAQEVDSNHAHHQQQQPQQQRPGYSGPAKEVGQENLPVEMPGNEFGKYPELPG